MLLAYAINDSEEMFMKIAVTYENGEVFQHFGHTEQFKLYEVSGGKLLQTQVWIRTAAVTVRWPACWHSSVWIR